VARGPQVGGNSVGGTQDMRPRSIRKPPVKSTTEGTHPHLGAFRLILFIALRPRSVTNP